jgi:hypothetical protein
MFFIVNLLFPVSVNHDFDEPASSDAAPFGI